MKAISKIVISVVLISSIRQVYPQLSKPIANNDHIGKEKNKYLQRSVENAPKASARLVIL